MSIVAERSVCKANASVESMGCYIQTVIVASYVPMIELQRIVSKPYSNIIVGSVVL